MFQPGAMVYTQGFGSRPENVEVPHIDVRAPTAQDVNYPIGKRWVDTVAGIEYVLTSISTSSGIPQADWASGGNEEATTTTPGIVTLATLLQLQNGNAPAGAYVPLSNDVATVIQGIVVGVVPPATELQQGIAEIATQAETDAGLDDTRIVTPLKLTTFIGGGGGPGSFTDLTATGAVTFTGATGALSMTSTTASSLGVTGAGIDLTLDSAAGQLILTGGEAAVNAVRIQADDAAGGIDVDAGTGGITVDTTGALSIDSAGTTNLTTTGAFDLTVQSTAGSVIISGSEDVSDAIQILSTAGGINIAATGEAAQDINITNTGGSVNLTATENAALALFLHANGGTSETIQVRADQGTGAASVELLSDAGGITLTGGAASATAINFTTTNAAGGVTVTAGTGGILPSTTGKFTVVSTSNGAQAIELHANGGTSETVRIRSDQGTGVASIDILSDVGGVTIAGGLGNADAVNITATTAGGGIDIDSSTGGFDLLTTGAISLDASLASNLTVTGAAVDLTLSSSGGSVVITGTEAAADAVQINATTALGGVDINAGTGGITIDTTGSMSFDSATTSNVTVTGAGADLNLTSVGGSVLVDSTENTALAIRLHANGGTSETIQIHSDQGTGVSSVGLLSDVGGITLRATGLASADAINLEAPAGGLDVNAALEINIDSSQAAATAINLIASNGAGGITMTTGSAGLAVTGNTVVTGDLTTSGNLILSGAGKHLTVEGGLVTDFIGTGVLTAGTQTIANTNIATGDVILISRISSTTSPTLGELTYTISNGASFTVTSKIIGTPASTQTDDLSTYAYFIVRPT